MKKLALITLLSARLWALPESVEVISGEALVERRDSQVRIEVSDKAILKHKSFHILEGEKVEFVQPTSKSTVLNRVYGNDLSHILGELSSNGRVFFINPNGICFGKNAVVNTGSFLASTLDILDVDFLNERFVFFKNGVAGSIVNEGSISAGENGFVALFAPEIENRGSILARVGRIALGAGERVALDFNGDGLIQFRVDERWEKTLQECGSDLVGMSPDAARRMVQSVVNTDGIDLAVKIEEKEGVIRLVGGSVIADRVEVVADQVLVERAHIDVSRDCGGGEALIGGDYQGKNEGKKARFTSVDADTRIYADALVEGDGGKVIVWAEDTAIFDGYIYARGGVEGGDGGFVETSGKENLVVTNGNVFTLSPNGKVGAWLMDPSSITIVRNNGNQGTAGLNTAATCSGGGFNLNDTTINNAASTVILCTAGTITHNNGAIINITTAGVGIQYGAASSPSSITFQTGAVTTWSLTTNNGPLTFNGPVVIPTGNTLSMTTTGGSVGFSSTINGAGPLTINAGAGTTTFTGAVGATTALTSANVTAATITQNSSMKTTGAVTYIGAINMKGNITTAGGAIGMTGAVAITGTPTFDSTNAGAAAGGATITFSSTLNGAAPLVLRAGTSGNVIFTGAVGNTAPLTNLSFTSANNIQIGSNITISGANPLTFPSPVLLNGTILVTSNNANVNFNSTVNNARAFTVAGGSGTTTFTGAVGGSTPLSSLTVISATITQSSTAKTTGAISYTGSTAINVNGNVTTSGSTIGMTGPVNITGAPTVDSTNGGVSAAGATITFSSTLNGAVPLVLRAGTAGNVIFTGAVGNTAPLTNLSFTSANNIQIGANITVSGANPLTFPSPVLLNGTSLVTSNNASVNFNSTVDNARAFTVAGGSGTTTFTGAVGGSTPLSSLTVTAATITQSSTAKTTGGISYIGATAINLGGNVTTSGASITMTGPVTISNNLTLDSTNGGGAAAGAIISFSSTVNGAVANTQDLTLRAGTAGNITFTGIVGGVTPLRSLTVASVNNWTAVAISASSITQNAGSGTTTFNGAINTSGASGIVLSGASANWNNNITTTGGGPLSVTHTGTLTIGAGVALSVDGAYSDLGPGSTVYLGGINLTTNASNILFAGPVNLGGTSSLSTGAGVGDILFNSTLDGNQNLTLLSGLGNIVFTGGVGQTTGLSTLQITSANNVTANALKAAYYNQLAGTGTTTLNGAVTLTGASGFAFTGNNLTINSTLSTAASQPVAISVAGTLILGASAQLNLDGTFTQSGAGTVQSAGMITTTNDTITFNGAVSITGASAYSTGAGAGDIIFASALNGPAALTLTAGTGNVTFMSAAGASSRLGALLINSATAINTVAVTASSINMTCSGTATLMGAYDTSGASGIQITSGAVNRSGTVNTTGGGSCTFTNSGTLTSTGNMTLSGSFVQNGTGSVSIQDTIATSGGNISFARAITETGSLALDTSAGSGNITLSSTVAATVAGAQNLTLTAGTGTILLNGTLGTTRLGSFNIVSAGNATVSGSINANTVVQNAGSGTTTFNGAITTTSFGGVSLAGSSFTLNSTINTVTGSGPMTVTNSGTLTIGASGALTIGSTFTQNGTGPVTLSGAITASDVISIARAITLSGTANLSTAAVNKNITLLSPVDGGGALTMAAGTGDISLAGIVGGGTRVGSFTISSAANVSATNITASSIHLISSVTQSLTNLNTNAVGGISLSGAAITVNGNLITTALGPVAIANTGALSLTAGASTSIAGAFTQTGGGAVLLSGTLTTANQNISFADPITLGGISSLATGGGNITLSSAVDGAFNFTLNAGTGSILASTNIGSTTRLGAFAVTTCGSFESQSITSASINITQTGIGQSLTLHNNINTNTASGITFNAVNIVRSGSITASNGGAATSVFSGTSTGGGGTIDVGSLSVTCTGSGGINFGGNVIARTGGVDINSPVTFLAAATVDSSQSGGTIHFHSTVNGSGSMSLGAQFTAGAGDVLFDGAVGGTNALLDFTIVSAANVTASSTFNATSFTQSGGSGTTTFSGAVNLSGALSVASANITRGAAMSASAIAFTVNAGGTFTSVASGTMAATSGDLTETGAATVNLAGALTTSGGNISFGSPITLAGTTSFTTSGGNVNVTSMDGAFPVNVSTGTGNFTATAAIGSVSRIGAFTVTTNKNTSLQAITAASINITATGGTTSMNGDVDTNHSAGVVFNINNFFRGGGITATNGGPYHLTFSGSASGAPGRIVRAGSVNATSTGIGSVNFGGTFITDTGGFILHTAANFVGDVVIDTSLGSGNIQFASTVNGAKNLSMTAGAGNILFDGAVGSVTPLAAVTISSANNVTASGSFAAASLVQAAGTGKTLFTEALSTTAVAGISLAGAQFEFDGAVTTTGLGPVAITNSGALTFVGGATLSSSLTQIGAGAVTMGGSITADGAISIASATTLNSATSLNTSSNASNITFSSTINGASPLSFNLGAGGNLLLSGAVGNTTRVGAFTIANAFNVTASNITAASITQSAAGGTSSFGALNTNTITGISLTGTGISLSGNVITTALGPLAIENSGTLTLAVGAGTSITGSFTQSGGGNVILSGTVLTVNQPITFTNAVSLALSSVVNSGGGKIWLKNTINGNNNLSLTADAGQIQLDGTIGATTPLSAITVVSCGDISYPRTSAASVTQNASSGTTTIAFPISASGSSGLSITGNVINQSSTLTTTGGGSIAIANSGLYTMSVGAGISSAGSFTQTGGGTVHTFGTISTSSANISFLNTIVLDGATTMSTSTGAGNIVISGAVSGVNDWTLDAGTGSITLSQAVSSIGAFQITSGIGNITAAISAVSIAQLAGSTTFGALSTSGASGISLTGTSFILGGPVTTSASGPLTIQNSGAVTLSGATFSIDGVLTQLGAGRSTISSAITAGGAISFAGPITASGGSLITTSDITLSNTVDGSGAFTLNAGSMGNISVLSNMGATTRLGALTITNCNNASFLNITAASVHQIDGQGTSTFGDINTNALAGVAIAGNNMTKNGFVTTTNGGPLHMTNSGTLNIVTITGTTLSGQYLQDGTGPVTIRGSLTTSNQPISFASAVTLTGALTLNSGSEDITFSSTVDGAFDLNLTAGTGSITASGAIGGTSRIGVFTVNSCTNLTLAAVTAASMNLTESGGTITFNSAINTNTASGIVINATNITRSGPVTATNGGSTNLTFTGSLVVTGSFAVNAGSVSVARIGGGSINFGGSITTDTGGIAIHSPVNLLADAVFNTTAGSGDIHFYDTLNGAHGMNLTLGTGNLFFDGAVGNTTPLTNILINTANNITASSSLSSTSFTQSAGTGTTTFTGALTTTGALSVTTSDVVRGSSISASAITFALNAGGVLTSMAAGATTVTSGAFTQTGGSVVNLADAITTSNANISFAAPIVLAGTTTLTSGGGDISMNTVDGAFALNLSAGASAGSINFSGDIGSSTRIGAFTVTNGKNVTIQAITAASVNITETGGTTTFNGNIDTNTSSGVVFHINNFFRGGGITATNGGPYHLTFSGTASGAPGHIVRAGSVNATSTGSVNFGGTFITDTGGFILNTAANFTGDVNIDTSISGGTIEFVGAVNGNKNLTMIAGSGNILFDAAVGNVTPLSAITITSANNVTASSSFAAASILQSAGTGKTLFSGTVATTAVAGIVLTGSQFEFGGALSTANNGPLSIAHTGLLTIPVAAPMTVDGVFTESGTSGTVSLGGNITTISDPISFANPITLTHDVIVDSGAGGGNISFVSPIDGTFCLTVTAGTANVQFSSAVGNLTQLQCISATGAQVIQASTLKTAATATYNGSIQLGGGITTTNSDVTLNGAVQIQSNLSVTTGSGAGNIYVVGAINGDVTGRNLTLTAGTGNVTLDATIGGSIRLNNFTVSGNAITFANLGSTGPGSTGVTTMTATGAMTFTGTNYNNGAQSYTASSFIFNQAATLTSSTNQPITFATGAIQLGSGHSMTINSNGGDVQMTTLTVTDVNMTNLIVNANTGSFIFTQLGTMANPLNVVTIGATGGSSTTPILNTNVLASSLATPTLTSLTGVIAFTGTYTTAVKLTGDVTINTACMGAGVTFAQAVDSDGTARSLTVNACGSPVNFQGPVGGASSLSFILVDQATTLDVSNTMVTGYLAETNGTSDTTLSANIDTTAMQGVNIDTTGAISITGGINASNSGGVTLNNGDTVAISGGSLVLDGAFQQTGATSVSISGATLTTGDLISFGSNVNLTGALTLSTSGGDIIFGGTVDGAEQLNLAAGSGSITFMDAVGGVTPITTFSINSANDVTGTAVSAASIVQSAGTGTTTFTGALATTDITGISLIGSHFTLSGTIITSGGGPLFINNSASSSITGGGSIAGALTQTGAGTLSLAGTTTVGGSVSIASAVTLSDNLYLNTSANQTNIAFASTLDGTKNLRFNVGMGGNLTLSGNVGSSVRVGDFTVDNAHDFTAQNITASTITQSAGSGTTSHVALNTNGAGGISLTGTNFIRSGSITTTGGGSFEVTNSGLLTDVGGTEAIIDGHYLQQGTGTVNAQGSITTNTSYITITAPLTLSNNLTLISADAITLVGNINGNSTLNLTAVGDITFGGMIGNASALGTLNVVSCHDITYPQTTVGVITQSASTGTTTLSSPINTLASGGLTITGTTINQSSTLTSSGGAIAIVNSSVYTMSMGASINAASGFTQSGGGPVHTYGSITTSSSNISFANAITLDGATLMSTDTGAGDIILSETVDGANDLTLAAGIGSIILNQDVGSITPVGVFTISSGASNITHAISATSLSQEAGSTTFNGLLLTSGSAGISLVGRAFTLNSGATTAALSMGPFVLQNTGSSSLSGAISVDTTFTQLGLGTVSLASDVTAGGAISFAGPITAAGGSLTTTTNITLSNTVDGSGALTLDAGSIGDIQCLSAIGATTRLGALTVTNVHNLTALNITAASFHQVDGQGTSTFSNINTNAVFGIVKNGTNFTRSGSIVTTNGGPLHVTHSGTLTILSESGTDLSGHYLEDGTGPVNILGAITTENQSINFAGSGAVTLAGALTLNSGSGAGDISFASAVDGAFDLTLTAGTGNVTFASPVGDTVRVGAFKVNSSTNLTLDKITAASIDLTESGGLITLNGDINTNTPTGITIHATSMVRSGDVTATNGGPATLVFSTSSMVTGNYPITVGSLSVTRTTIGGIINFGGSVTTDTGGIDIHSPVNFLATAFLDTSLSGGSIHFYEAVNGAHDLTATLGAGSLIFDAAVGNTTPLGDILIHSASNVTVSSTFAAGTFTQEAGSGTTTFSGAASTSGAMSIATAHFVRGSTLSADSVALTINAGGIVTSTASGATTVATGNYSISGAAQVNLADVITTTMGSIAISSPIVLSGTTTLTAGATGTAIGLPAVNGANALNLTASAGNISFTGAIGATTRIGALTAVDCVNFTSQAVTAASLSITATGLTSINGNVNTNTSSGVTFNTQDFFRGGGITATNGGPYILVFSGTATGTAGQIIRSGSVSATRTGVGSVNFGGTFITDTGGFILHTPANFVGDLVIDTSLGSGNIQFAGTVDGNKNVTLTAGTGNILFDGAVGGTTPLGALTISSANNVTMSGSFAATSILQAAGTGKMTFTSALTTTGGAGISLTGSQFEFDAAITTSNAGPLIINNSGALTLVGDNTIDGVLTQSGAGAVTLAGSSTIGGAVSFAGAVTLSGATSLDTSANKSNITFSSTVNGANDLTVNLGNTGDLLFSGNMGNSTRLGAFTITNVHNATLQAITASSILQSAGAGTSTFGAQNTNGASGIVKVGTNFVRNGSVTTTGGGSLHVTNSGTLTVASGTIDNIDGYYLQDGAGPVNARGTVNANSYITITSALNLTEPLTLNTSSGSGVITLSGNINGAQTLNLNAGAQDIVFGGTVGNGTPLSLLNIINCKDITYPTTTAATITQSASSGTTTLSSPVSSNGSSGITIHGSTIDLSSSLTSNGTGPIVIVNSGPLTMSMGASINAGGGFNQSGGGAVHTYGTISAASSNISIFNNITLDADTVITTSSGAGNIILSGSVDGANNLTLIAGTGAITLNSAVGPIAIFEITSGSGNTTGAITATKIIQSSGSSTFGALTTSDSAGISLVGTSFTLSGNIDTTTGSGPLLLSNSAVSTLSGTTFAIGGALNQTGSGQTTISSQITAGDFIQFLGPVVTSGSPTLNTNAAAQPITFLNTINGPGHLTLDAGASNIQFASNVGAATRLGNLTLTAANNVTTLGIKAASVTQSAGSGTTAITGDLNTTTGFNLTGSAFTINGSLLSSSAGPSTIDHTGLLTLLAGSSTLLSDSFTESGLGGAVSLSGLIHANNSDISFANPITLLGATTLNSDGGGDITISSPIDGPFPLTYNSGTGDIFLNAAIGSSTPVTSLTITAAHDVSAASTISAGTITQAAGTGLTSFDDVLTTSLAQGIHLTGNQFSFGANVNTSGGGIVTIANSGLLTLPAAAAFNIDGAFSQTGSGNVSLCTTITTTGDIVSFAGAVTLCNDATIDTGTLAGGITFANTLTGAHHLTLNSGAGNIQFQSSVSGLSYLEVASCVNLTSQAISATHISVDNLTGLGTFNGALSAGASGITLSGSSFTFNGNVTTTSGAALSITNSGLLNISPSITLNLSGPFTQSGAGSISLGGALITDNQNITFSAPIELIGNLSLTSGGGNILLGSDVEGPFSVTITAGTGDVTIPNSFSIEDPLHNFTVISAHDILLNGMGTPTVFMSGTLSLTASGTISMMNTNYSAHAMEFASGADLNFIHSGLITLRTDGGSIAFNSANTYLNSSTDLSIITSGGNFSFVAIHGTNFENFSIDTGSGTANLGALPSVGHINTVTVNAGQILLSGVMNLVNTDFTSQHAIQNSSIQVDIVSSNTASFNALGGDVGTLTSPILVNTDNLIFAGSTNLADFDGTSLDNTVHEIPSNPPCIIIFNGVEIKHCTPPAPPPTPSAAPAIGSAKPFPGGDSSFFNLASDYYFKPYFLMQDYLRKPVLLYASGKKNSPPADKVR